MELSSRSLCLHQRGHSHSKPLPSARHKAQRARPALAGSPGCKSWGSLDGDGANVCSTSYAPCLQAPQGIWCRQRRQGVVRMMAAAGAGDFSDGSSSSNNGPSSSGSSTSTAIARAGVFGDIERSIVATFGGGGPGGDWQEVENCWVLMPQDRAPVAVVHFVGGAFVGAAPQLSYKLFLEELASRGVAVVATPFATSFDHISIADEVQFKFSRCMSVLGSRVVDLPVYGVGHSMGALLHMLVHSRYVLPRAGNVLISYNNRPATDSIPFLSPFIIPSAKALGPLLSALASNPLAASASARVNELLKGFGPDMVRQVVPLLEQLQPIYEQVAAGRQEFVPSPPETRDLIRTYYGVPRNLLLRFTDDTLDQTAELADVLQSGAAAAFLDMRVRVLPGDHIRPLQQDVPPEVMRAATSAAEQGSSLLTGLIGMARQAGGPLQAAASAPLEDLAKGVNGLVADLGERLSPNAGANISALVDEVEAYMLGGTKGSALPAAGGSSSSTTAAATPSPYPPSSAI